MNYADDRYADTYRRLSGRSGSWHKAGRSSRLAEEVVSTGSGASSPGRSPEQRGGEQKKTMISEGKVQLKQKQNRRKGGERGACVRISENPG